MGSVKISNKKYAVIISVVLLFFLVISSVSAADLNSSDDNTDLLDNCVPYSDVYNDYISQTASPDGGENDDLNSYGVKPTVLSGNDTELYYKNGTAFKVVLSDYDGSLLAGQSVIFTINGVNYTRVTDNCGVASITINLNSGTYTISYYFAGNENYSSFYGENTVKVLSTIDGDDVEKYFKNDTQYYVTFVDGQGNFLNGQTVTFNINGVFYQRKTDEKGTAKLNINLSPGEYIITAVNPVNGEMYSNIITVLPTILGSDIEKYYKNDTQYYIRVLNGAGNPLINQEVTFNINGVFYTRITDAGGIAKMNINLNPGKYIITATNPMNGEMHSNIIEVLPTISADDLDMTYRDGHRFMAHVLDDMGNPLAGSDVTFNVNGVLYTHKTDNEGNAYLNINLGVGKYIITATNYKGLSVSKIINIGKAYSVIEANDAHIITGFDRNYIVTLSGSNNQLISSSTIKFKFNGAEMRAVTNKNGEATLFISNPSKGTYSIEYEFEGNANYYPYKSSSTITVADSTTVLSGNDLKMMYNESSVFNVTLTDLNSVPIVNKTVTFTVCGVSYNHTTDENGVAGLNINLLPGTYEISYSYSYEEAPDYNKGSNTIVVSKLPAYLTTSDLEFEYGESKAFSAILTDGSGNPLKDTAVTFTIGGRSYTKTTDASGVAKLNIRLSVGYYEIITSLDDLIFGASSKSNHILVNGTILLGDDLYLIDGFSRVYSVMLMDAYRNPISNALIEFTYNGVYKTAFTNDCGIATITVGDLSEGIYPIVYKYVDGDNTCQANILVSNSVLNYKNAISDLSPYLSVSQNCQVTNAEIVALARQLTEGLSTSLDKAIAIFEYVKYQISYSYYYDTYYGALGTLHAKTGNCVDQAHLSIALYRAAGLPARYVHGRCVFSDGDVSGHVWSQVLIGDTWVVSDTINTRNSLGEVVNWNNYNYVLKGLYSAIYF